jgi:hypothetical protein
MEMSGQGKSTIDPRVATSFMSRTVQSARKHGVMRTVARCAQLWFGHHSHVGALRSRMTHQPENDATRNIGTFPTKRQRKKGNEGWQMAGLNDRWLWRQTEGLNALTTIPRGLVNAAAKHFTGLTPGNRQA